MSDGHGGGEGRPPGHGAGRGHAPGAPDGAEVSAGAAAGQVLSLIRFRVFEGQEGMLGKLWLGQRNMLREQEGFLSAELLSGGERGGEGGEYVIMTRWAAEEHLDAWKQAARAKGGERMARMLRGESKMVSPPYEVSRWRVLVSSGGEDAGDGARPAGPPGGHPGGHPHGHGSVAGDR